MHWHGLRVDNAYDGVPHETQAPIPVGGEFSYQLRFPDPGLYWYHPHIREDYGLDMGLYGNIVVDPTDSDYWPPVDREHVITLDDVLVEDGRIAPFNVDGPTHVAMGRFGNVMLTAGATHLDLSATVGEVVRFYFTNTANTRLFNIALPGARMKLIGGDSGRNEHETFVGEVLLAPSERAIVDVVYDRAGTYHLEHHTPSHTYLLGTVTVSEAGGLDTRPSRVRFETLRTAAELTAERTRVEADRVRPPDKTLAFESLMPLLYGNPATATGAWTCPMHPDVLSDTPGACPSCGMKLIPAVSSAAPSDDHTHGHDHGHDAPDGLEWEDLMPEINRASDSSNMTWKLVDPDTGAENGHIDWTFRARRPGEDPARERDGSGPPDAPPVPHPRRRPLPRARPRRPTRRQPGVEGHGARAFRRDRRHPPRRHQRGPVDGPLPHRRAQPGRHDVQLPSHGRGLAMSAAWTNPAVAVQTAAATDVTGPASSRDLAPCAAFSDPSPRLRRHHSRCAATTHLLTEADMTTPKEVAR